MAKVTATGAVVVDVAVQDVLVSLRRKPNGDCVRPRVKPDGRTCYDCRCPVHADQHASLFVTPLSNGKTLVKCMAGCKPELLARYFAALENGKRMDHQANLSDANDGVVQVAARLMNGRIPDHVYRYSQDFAVCRWDGADGGKIVRPFSRDAAGVWHPTTQYAPTPRPLYRTRDDHAWRNCLVVEGEKAVEHFRRHIWNRLAQPDDWLCVTSSGGSNAARLSDWRSVSFPDRYYFLWPDNDEPGRKYMSEVLELLKAGGARYVQCIDPVAAARECGVANIPPPGFDIADYPDPDRVAAFLDRLAAQYDPSLQLVWRKLDEVKDEPVEWLWPRVVPAGALTIFFGQPGIGKSYMTCELAARVSSGTGFVPFTHDGVQTARDVVLIALEDHIGSVVRWRIEGCGGDLSRIYVLEGIRDQIGDTTVPLRLSDESHIAAIDGLLRRIPDPALLVIDPLTEALGVQDAYSETAVRQGFLALRRLMVRYPRMAIIGVMHDSKQRNQRGAMPMHRVIDTLINSRAFSALARSIVHFSAIGETPLRVINVIKSSWGRRPPPALWCLRPSYTAAGHVAVQWLGTTRASLLDIDITNWRQKIDFFRPEWSGVELAEEDEE